LACSTVSAGGSASFLLSAVGVWPDAIPFIQGIVVPVEWSPTYFALFLELIAGGRFETDDLRVMSRKNRHTGYNASTLRHTNQRKPGMAFWLLLVRFVPPIRTTFGQSETNLAPRQASSGLFPDRSWTQLDVKFKLKTVLDATDKVGCRSALWSCYGIVPTFPVSAVVSMGRRNTKFEPTLQ
jgi:hypothetical protein